MKRIALCLIIFLSCSISVVQAQQVAANTPLTVEQSLKLAEDTMKNLSDNKAPVCLQQPILNQQKCNDDFDTLIENHRKLAEQIKRRLAAEKSGNSMQSELARQQIVQITGENIRLIDQMKQRIR